MISNEKADNENIGYWKIQGTEGTIPLFDTYRAEENAIVHHPSPLTLVFIEMNDANHLRIRQYAPTERYDIIAEWEGPHASHSLKPVLQRHDCYELAYVICGSVEILIENGDFIFHEGEAFLLNRFTRNAIIYQEHSVLVFLCMGKNYWTDGLLKDEVISFHHHKISQFLSTNIRTEFYNNRDYLEFREKNAECRLIIGQLFSQIRKELNTKKPGFALMARGLTLRLLMYMDDPKNYVVNYISLGPSKDRDIVEDIKNYMQEHPYRILRKEIAEIFHFSEGYLSVIFKRFTGQTLSEYNQHIYLKEANRLLRESNQSISEIAKAVGFVNRTQFYRIYEAEFGESPKQTRINQE